MYLRGLEDGRAVLELSHDELLIMNNALNEVCNGLDLPEFATRIGAQRDEARWLLREIGDAIGAVEGQLGGDD
jgi:hypothetical protein